MVAEELHTDRTQTHVVLTKGTTVSHYRIVEKSRTSVMGNVLLMGSTGEAKG